VKAETQRGLRRLIARFLIVTTTSALATPQAHAATISTEAAVVPDRERILVLLDRPDVGRQLEAYGVKPADAKARIAALTDAEVAQLAAGIDSAPAGGFVQFIGAAAAVAAYVIGAAVILVAAAVVGIVRAIGGSEEFSAPAPEPL
jgi:hypothetical protein